ncbi:MAG TPA: MarR family transcriptional regulator [Jiangellaceae bacterium]|nr:MarR family transcriptional regulator [Jiangellaceae bacterium]
MNSPRIWASMTHLGQRVPLAWVRFLAAHDEVTGPMDQNLRASHGLTINDYEVLLRLCWAPDGRLTRSELAQSVHLTQGGITRLLAGLGQAGMVRSVRSPADRRVIYAEVTEAGREQFRLAVQTHVEDVQSMFTDRFSTAELETLAELLGRLTDTEAEPEDPPDPAGFPPGPTSG